MKINSTTPVRWMLASVLGATALVSAGVPIGSTSAPAAAASAAAEVVDTRPNIVMITADDMRADDLRVMPNTRRLLAAQGTSFTRSYAPFSLCCPARASWMTGQYSHNNGVMGNASSDFPLGGFAGLDSSSTVATWLKDAGYQTAFVGKYLNKYGLVKPVVVPPGWDEWHAGLGDNNYFST